MPYVHPRHFLDDQFPISARQAIPTILRTAYSAARRLADEEQILQVCSAKQNFGRLVSWSVDLGIEKAIETGVLPFDYSWESFDKPTGKFLAVRPSHSVVTVSLTRTPTKQPRTVVFRQQQKQVNSQLDLLDGVTEPMEITGLPHILLLHDYRDPEFAHLGIPRADCDQDFSYRTENLFKLPHEVEPQGPAPEGPDDAELDAVFQLKEDIDRWRKENGNS